MTQDQKVKHFAQSLRRILYMMQIIGYNIEDLKSLEVTPPHMKHELNGITNAFNRFLTTSKMKCSVETWEAIQTDLSKDSLHDLSLLLDAVSDVKNIDTIVDVITTTKQQAA